MFESRKNPRVWPTVENNAIARVHVGHRERIVVCWRDNFDRRENKTSWSETIILSSTWPQKGLKFYSQGLHFCCLLWGLIYFICWKGANTLLLCCPSAHSWTFFYVRVAFDKKQNVGTLPSRCPALTLLGRVSSSFSALFVRVSTVSISWHLSQSSMRLQRLLFLVSLLNTFSILVATIHALNPAEQEPVHQAEGLTGKSGVDQKTKKGRQFHDLYKTNAQRLSVGLPPLPPVRRGNSGHGGGHGQGE